MRETRVKNYLWLHAAGVLAAAALLGYHYLLDTYLPDFVYCVMHDLLGLYCPFCGRTRVIVCLLRLDLRGAFLANPVTLFALLSAVVLDAHAGILLLRKRRSLLLPRAYFPLLAALYLLWWIIRLVLVFGFEIDPLGDLLP